MDEREKVICNWRVCAAEPSGLLVWFDPARERVRLYELPHSDGVVDPEDITEVDVGWGGEYLDKVVSMRAVEAEAEPASLDEGEQGVFEFEDPLPF